MNTQIFLVPQARMQARWQQAFPDAVAASNPEEAIRLATADSIFWIGIEQREWMSDIRKERPGAVIVAVTLTPSSDEGLAALELGARGYCHALSAPPLLQQVALVVGNGGLWLGSELMARATAAIGRLTAAESSDSSAMQSLTERERAVAGQVAQGASNKEIAERLKITPRTVKAHMSAIFDKLGVRDRLQLVLSLRRGSRSTVANQ